MHFLPNEKGPQGVCRRNPPSVVMIPGRDVLTGAVKLDTASSWPPVLKDHYCGEFSMALPNVADLRPAESDKPN